MMEPRMIPDELVKDVETLKEQGYDCRLVEDGLKIYVVFTNYPLPPGIYNIDSTDLIIFTTSQYPNAGFDMFWVDEKLKLKGTESPPSSAEHIESHLGKNWRRFSYHPYNNKPWNPSEDSVIRHVSYINQRLRKGD